MSKIVQFFKRSYVYFILLLTYIPLIFALIFSFNQPTKKGSLSFAWNGFTNKGWTEFFEESRDLALANSILIAICVSIIVVTLSLLTVFALWKQHNKTYEGITKATYNIPLINPDNITAIGLVLVYTLLFGSLSFADEGLFRAIMSHSVIALPYGITLMYPASEKFNKNLFEASQDLGYNKFQTWFKTYFMHMIPSIIFVMIVSVFLSFDDYIITRLTSNTSTLGTKLYEGEFRLWGLVVGGALMVLTLAGTGVYILAKRKEWKWKKVK